MVIDYYDIDKAVKPFIDMLDHAFLVDNRDSIMIEFLNSNNMKHKIIPFFSTAENIVTYLMEEIYPVLTNRGNLHSITLRIYETNDVFAEISRTLK
jgi:6-pyruvoyl-tetrahydropterin synthase